MSLDTVFLLAVEFAHRLLCVKVRIEPAPEMERQHLATRQAEAPRARIRPMLHFLYLCRRRLDVSGFDQKGAIYQAIDKPAMHSLHVALIYEA